MPHRILANLFTEELQHVGAFIIALTGFIGTLWGITLYFVNWLSKARTKTIIEANTASIQSLVQSRMMETIKDMDPARFYTLDLHFKNGLSMVVPMLPDRPLYVCENVQIKVVSHTPAETTMVLTCKGFGHIIPHYHAHTCETIEIREGTMTCCESGMIYRKGDVWRIAVGEMHSAQFQDCIAIITHKPPLPSAAERPVNLENMPKIFTPP